MAVFNLNTHRSPSRSLTVFSRVRLQREAPARRVRCSRARVESETYSLRFFAKDPPSECADAAAGLEPATSLPYHGVSTHHVTRKQALFPLSYAAAPSQLFVVNSEEEIDLCLQAILVTVVEHRGDDHPGTSSAGEADRNSVVVRIVAKAS